MKSSIYTKENENKVNISPLEIVVCDICFCEACLSFFLTLYEHACGSNI
jgi:hypothetical protein